MRARVGLGLGVIAALAVAIWAAVAQGGDETPSTTTTLPPSTTSAPPTTISTTTVAPTSTTTTPTTPGETTATTVDAEARAEEVRLILQDLYYGWFTAIYNEDENTVLEVIATQRYLEDFRRAITTLEYPRAPEKDEIVVTELEILRDTEECLVTYSTIDVTSWLGDDAIVTGVDVLLPVDGEWRFGTAWIYKEDLWQRDCEIEPDL